MLKRIAWFALAACCACAFNASARDKRDGAVLIETFDAGRSGFAAALLKDRQLSLAEGQGVGRSAAIKAVYEGNDHGSKRIEVGYMLPRKGLEFTLNYDLRFCDGFQFVKGGKLPGLRPDRPVSGGNKVSAEKWSARLMFGGKGGVKTYVYHQDMPKKYGESVNARNFWFETNRYYAISYHVRLNDPPSAANGYASVFVDGEEVVKHENIRFRGTGSDDTLISGVMFSTFHGGNSPDWAPRGSDGAYTSVCAYFDNFAVYSGVRVRASPGN